MKIHPQLDHHALITENDEPLFSENTTAQGISIHSEAGLNKYTHEEQAKIMVTALKVQTDAPNPSIKISGGTPELRKALEAEELQQGFSINAPIKMSPLSDQSARDAIQHALPNIQEPPQPSTKSDDPPIADNSNPKHS